MFRLFSLLLSSFLSGSVLAQTYTIQTVAGGGLPENIPALSASLGSVTAVAVDAAGNVFIALSDFTITLRSVYSIVLRMDARTGILTRVAGTGTDGYSGDNGPATSAQLNNPQGIALDSAGNLYIADLLNYCVRKVSNGIITTVAGNGSRGFDGDDGPATSVQLNWPQAVAVDQYGNLYIVDENRIRKVSNGVITTVAGTGGNGYNGDNGPATSAWLYEPKGIALDSSGNLYIADTMNNRVRKISHGVITTVVGNGTQGESGDNGPAASAELRLPEAVAVDLAGNLYIADLTRVLKVSNGVITTVAGGGFVLGDNGPATSAQLLETGGIAVDPSGNLYIADSSNNRVRKVSGGVITTMAGGGSVLGDTGPATSAQLEDPLGVAVDSSGDLYIADTRNYRVRKVSHGVITTVAGNGTRGFSGDNGPATSAQLSLPAAVAVDPAGNLYIADLSWVRKVSNGVITTAAGNGTPAYSGDNGPATSAQLNGPQGLAVDSSGDLYIADTFNYRVRKVSNGVITTVVGNGTGGFSGDNGPATSARLSRVSAIAVDAANNLYLADPQNRRVRKVSNGVITTVAGGGAALGDNVSATSAYLGEPESVAIDPYGNLYIGDGSGVRKISNGVITTVAGNGTAGYSGDNGPALNAQLSGPAGLAMGSAGNVYVADSYNKRIRVLIPAPPQISLAGIGSAASYKAGQVSPGEIIVVYGNSFGPAALAQMQIANGFVGTTLGNTRIYFDGTPAPMIYAAAGVLSCVVPYEVAGTTQVQVEYSGLKGNTIPVPVVTAVPAIFSLNQSGTGQGAILNQDYSLNGTSNPAASGSVVMVFATGEGKTDLGVDGKITPMAGPWPEPLLQPWTATVGGKASPRIWYAGAAPGNVAGVFQVNMQIPADLTPGMAVLIIKSGGFSSQSVLIVAVK